MITTIEKQLLVEASFAQHWKLFCFTLPILESKPVASPVLECVNKGCNSAGLYYPARKLVVIDLAYIPDNMAIAGKIGYDVEEIIAHEIAHHITHALYPLAKQAHGPQFKDVLRSIGYSGDTYHKMNPSRAKRTAASTVDTLIDL